MTKTMFKTMSVTAITMLAAVILLPTTGSARTTDQAYCGALVERYQRYIDTNSSRNPLPQSVETRHAAELCKKGDARGIAGLEKALQGARIPLPSRG